MNVGSMRASSLAVPWMMAVLIEPAHYTVDDDAPEARQVVLDLLPEAQPATGEEGFDVAPDEVEDGAAGFAELLDDDAADSLLGEAQDLQDDAQDRPDVPGVGQGDAELAQGAHQPLEEACLQVIDDIGDEQFEAELDRAEHVPHEGGRVVDDDRDGLFHLAHEPVELLGRDAGEHEGGFQQHPQHLGPVAGEGGLDQRAGEVDGRPVDVEDAVHSGANLLGQLVDLRDQVVGDRAYRLLRESDRAVDHRLQRRRQSREEIPEQVVDEALQEHAAGGDGVLNVAGGELDESHYPSRTPSMMVLTAAPTWSMIAVTDATRSPTAALMALLA